MRCSFEVLESGVMSAQRIHCLNFQQQTGRILKRILDRDQEGNRVGAIDDTMVVYVCEFVGFL